MVRSHAPSLILPVEGRNEINVFSACHIVSMTLPKMSRPSDSAGRRGFGQRKTFADHDLKLLSATSLRISSSCLKSSVWPSIVVIEKRVALRPRFNTGGESGIAPKAPRWRTDGHRARELANLLIDLATDHFQHDIDPAVMVTRITSSEVIFRSVDGQSAPSLRSRPSFSSVPLW